MDVVMENRRVIYQRQSLTSPSAVFGWASPYGSARGRDSYYVSRLWRHWPSFLVLVSGSRAHTSFLFSDRAVKRGTPLLCEVDRLPIRASQRRWNNAGESVAELRNDGHLSKKSLIVRMLDKMPLVFTASGAGKILVVRTARWMMVKTQRMSGNAD